MTTSYKDPIDDLSAEQLKELNESIKEADNGEIISWSDFKKEMDEWKKKLCGENQFKQ